VITELGEGYLDGEISTDEDEPDEIREKRTTTAFRRRGVSE